MMSNCSECNDLEIDLSRANARADDAEHRAMMAEMDLLAAERRIRELEHEIFDLERRIEQTDD